MAVLFFLGRFLRALAKNAVQSLAPLAALLLTFEGSLQNRLLLAAGLALLVMATVSVVGYLKAHYGASQEAITKKQLDIKFDRIQGVDTEQNFVYRWFDLVNIRFDTAGSSENEGYLPAVTAEFARDLQDRIDGQRNEVADTAGDEELAAIPTAAPMLTLDWRDMVKIGLADRRALIVFAILGPFLEQLGDEADNMITAYAESAFDRVSEFGFAGGSLIVLAVVLLVALLLALASIGAAVFRYHNFQLTLDGNKLRSTGGLATRHQVSMNVGKVQRIRMSQGLILRRFDRFRLAAQQATSSGSKNESSSFKVPLVTRAFGETFSRRVFAGEADTITMDPASPDFMQISRRYVRSRTLVYSLPIMAVLATPVAMGAGPFVLVLLVIPAVVYLVARRYWRRFGYYHDNDALVRRFGLIGYDLEVFLSRKVQRVTVTQSWLQRRRHLAGLRIFLASGSVRIPYIPIEDAKLLRDYILYKVESSQRAWH